MLFQITKNSFAINLLSRLALSLVIVLCSASVSAASAQEVNTNMVGGSFEPSIAGYKVAFIVTHDHACSGALVGKYAILTAAHCVAQVQTTSDFAVYVGRDWYQVESAWYHSKFDPNQTVNRAAKYDLGMLILNRPVTSIKPLSILSGRRVKRGAQLLIAGYGTNELSNDPMRSMFDNFKIGVASVVKADGHHLFSTYRSNGASTCAGDSGGPASVAYGRTSIALAGVVSAGVNTVSGDNRCELRADGLSMYVDLQSPSSKAFLRAFRGIKYVR
jgi:V8-like Glu-specific endopeptidase